MKYLVLASVALFSLSLDYVIAADLNKDGESQIGQRGPEANMQIPGYPELDYRVDKEEQAQNVRVIESSLGGQFEREAKKALQRFSFTPLLMEGEPLGIPAYKTDTDS